MCVSVTSKSSRSFARDAAGGAVPAERTHSVPLGGPRHRNIQYQLPWLHIRTRQPQ